MGLNASGKPSSAVNRVLFSLFPSFICFILFAFKVLLRNKKKLGKEAEKKLLKPKVGKKKVFCDCEDKDNLSVSKDFSKAKAACWSEGIKGAAAAHPKLDCAKSISKKEVSTQEKNEFSKQQPVILELETKDYTPFTKSIKMPETQEAQAKAAELANMLAEQNKELFYQWAEHNTAQNQDFLNHWAEQNLNSLSKVFEEKSNSRLPNSVKMPSFGGNSDEDVNSFISKYNRIAEVQNWSESRKTRMLPFCFKDHAEAWFDSSPESEQKNFSELTEALRQKFDSRSTKYRLRQELNERKQGNSESVADFVTDVRRICRRIKLTDSEAVNYFVQGLRSDLREFVMLKEPQSLEQAEDFAKLKETVPEDRTLKGKMDKLIEMVSESKLQKENSNTIAAMSFGKDFNQGELLKRDIEKMVSEQVAEQLRHFKYKDRGHPSGGMRNRRTADGRPICNFCNKPNHIYSVCPVRLGRNRPDPRIPSDPNPVGYTHNESYSFGNPSSGNNSDRGIPGPTQKNPVGQTHQQSYPN